jgi:hypothetical protein
VKFKAAVERNNCKDKSRSGSCIIFLKLKLKLEPHNYILILSNFCTLKANGSEAGPDLHNFSFPEPVLHQHDAAPQHGVKQANTNFICGLIQGPADCGPSLG